MKINEIWTGSKSAPIKMWDESGNEIIRQNYSNSMALLGVRPSHCEASSIERKT